MMVISSLMQVVWQISWQAALVAGVVWAISRLTGKAPAAWRHALWVVVLVKLFVPPFAYVPEQLAFWQSSPPPMTAPAPSLPPATETTAPVSEAVPAPPVIAESTVAAEESSIAGVSRVSGLSIVAWAWVLGVCAMSVLLLMRIVRQRRLLMDAAPTDSHLTDLMHDCASRLGVGRVPDVLFSECASTPMLVGLLRPRVLLPPGITESCTPNDLRAMFMHELAHVKRWDMAFVWLHQIAQVFFFFHPAVWLAGREMRRERELACDEMVLSTDAITREEYAAGYVSALKLANTDARPSAILAMAEPFDIEMRRINMIVRNAVPRMSMQWIGAFALIVMIALPTFGGISAVPSVLTPAELTQPRMEVLVDAGLGGGTGEVGIGTSPPLYEYTGPAMFQMTRDGMLWVLDRVNRRVLAFKDGKQVDEISIYEFESLVFSVFGVAQATVLVQDRLRNGDFILQCYDLTSREWKTPVEFESQPYRFVPNSVGPLGSDDSALLFSGHRGFSGPGNLDEIDPADYSNPYSLVLDKDGKVVRYFEGASFPGTDGRIWDYHSRGQENGLALALFRYDFSNETAKRVKVMETTIPAQSAP